MGLGDATSAARQSAGRRLIPPSWGIPVLIGGITLIGLGLRLPMFEDPLAADELSTYFVVAGGGVRWTINVVAYGQEATPPLYFLVAKLTQWFGDPWEGLRVPSLLAGIAAIPLTYLLGLRTVGRPAAIVGACLVAVNPFLIVYSDEARSYSLSMLLILLSTLALVQALDDRRTRSWVVYAALVCAAMYTHYTAVFVLGAQFGWAFLARPEARRSLIIATVGAAIAWLPWWPGFQHDSQPPRSTIIEALQPFTWEAVKDDLLHWTILNPSLTAKEVPGKLGLWLIIAGAIAGALGATVALQRAGGLRWRPSEGVTLVIALGLAMPVLGAIYSMPLQSVYLPRNFIGSSPGLALMVGALLTAGRGWIRIVAPALVIAGFAIGAVRMADPRYQKPDYPAVVDYIDGTGPPGAPIVEAPFLTAGPQTPLEATLGPPREELPGGHPVYPVGIGSLEDRIALSEAHQPGPALLPAVDPLMVAADVRREARDGTYYLVLFGAYLPVTQLRASVGPVTTILRALPGFREVDAREFTGYGVFPVTVYKLSNGTAPQ